MISSRRRISHVVAVLSVVLLVPVATATADQYVTIQNGSWSDPNTWSDISGLGGGMGAVPGPSDEATITTDVTLPGATEVGGVALSGGGSLDLEGHPLTDDGDFMLGDTVTATLQSSGSQGAVSVAGELNVQNASVSDVDTNVASSNGSSPSTVFGAHSTWSGSTLTQTGGTSTLDQGETDGLDPTLDGVAVSPQGTSIFPAGMTLSGTGSLNFVPAGAGATNSPAILQLGSLTASGTQTVNTYWYGYTSGTPADGDIVNLVSTTSGTPAGLTATSDSNTTYATTSGVLSATYAGPVPPAVSSQPQDALVAPGANASFTAAATGSNSVQWQRSTDGGSIWTDDNSDSGATSDTLVVDAVTTGESGDEYRAVFTNGAGSTDSDAATLTVGSSPLVATQPSSATFVAGQDATFTAAATGTPAPTVQWQVSTDGGSAWTADSSDSGTTTDTLTVSSTTLSESGHEYRAVFTNAHGSDTSAAVTLTVVALLSDTVAPTIASSNAAAGQAAQGDTLTCAPGTWSLSSAYAYAWQRDGSTISGQAASSYTVTSGDVGATLRCTVTATAGAQSVTATASGSINVPAAPTIALTGPPATVTTTSTSAPYTLGAGDAVTGCALDGGALPSCGSPIGLSGYTAGTHTLTVTARNSAGTTATARASFVADLGPALKVGMLAIGSGPGQGSHVEVIDPATGQTIAQFSAFDPAFTGGVSVALADVNGDGIPDLVVGAGPGGGSEVKVIDGTKLDEVQANGEIATSALLADFHAFNVGSPSGVSVAAADLNGNGRTDIVVGAGRGGPPEVKIIDGTGLDGLQAGGEIANSLVLADFYAFNPAFTGGVSVAASDVGARHDLVVGAGAGGGPNIEVFDGAQLTAPGSHAAALPVASFFAFDPHFIGGVSVAVADVNESGTPDIVVGPGAGGGPEVKVFDGATFAVLADYMAYTPTFFGGVNVAASSGSVVTAQGQGGSTVDLFHGTASTPLDLFEPFPGSAGGYSVAVDLPGSSTSTSIPAQVTVGRASAAKGAATVSVGCAGSNAAACKITATLTLATGSSGHATAVTAIANKRRKPSPSPQSVGVAKATIPAGTSKKVTVPLNRTGRRLLAKRHRLKVRLVITKSGRATADLTIIFKATSPKKRR